jgi:hypothetical protein
MTKKISDEELANVSGAGEASVVDSTQDTVSKKQSPGGSGGPGVTPDTEAPGADPADLSKD